MTCNIYTSPITNDFIKIQFVQNKKKKTNPFLSSVTKSELVKRFSSEAVYSVTQPNGGRKAVSIYFLCIF